MLCHRLLRLLVASVAFALALSRFACGVEGPRPRLLLRGDVVTPDGILSSAWLDIRYERILRITREKPDAPGVPVIETTDLIFPGFIDLHNHPAFNIFPRWTPPHTFANRYEWRDSDVYAAQLEHPESLIAADESNFCDVDEFVEIKALIGGTTSMIGLTAPYSPKGPPECIKGLVRNLGVFSGFYAAGADERILNSIGILPRDMDANTAARDAQALADGTADLLAIHIAEGLPTDPESAQELDLLDAHGLLTSHTALIHAVGLSPAQIARVHRAGAAIVWSPHSNFVLYGATARVDAAFREGVTLALAPDWSPTGSDNMLDELKYASAVSHDKLDGLFSARQLVEMASAIPARIAAIGDRVGTLAPGMLADLFLLRRPPGTPSSNPYEALLRSSVTDIDLVMINGVPVYGESDLLRAVAANTEPISICGATRALNSDALPNGPFAAVTTRLQDKMHKAGAELGPLAECVR